MRRDEIDLYDWAPRTAWMGDGQMERSGVAGVTPRASYNSGAEDPRNKTERVANRKARAVGPHWPSVRPGGFRRRDPMVAKWRPDLQSPGLAR